MEKKILSIVLILALVPLLQAEIFISQPSSVYNLGDTLNTSLKITGKEEGVIKLSLVCNDKFLFYADYLDLKEGEEKSIEKELKLKNRRGLCYLSSELSNKEVNSQLFFISNKLKLDFKTSKETLFPEEEVSIDGFITKENSQPISGTAEIYLNEMFIKNSEIKEGNFKETIKLPKNLSLYEYDLVVKAHDAEKLNSQETKKKLYIKSIPTSIEVNISNAKAGENLIFLVSLLDQNQKIIEKNISLTIESPKKLKITYEAISGKTNYFFLSDNSSTGDWKVSAFSSNLETEKHFYINENEKVSIEIEGDIIVIKNIGNTNYKKLLEIGILGETKYSESIQVDLDIGKEAKYKLSASPGEYTIKVGEKNFGKVRLTGNALDVKKVSDSKALSPIIGILVLIAILAGLFFLSHGSMSFKMKNLGKIFSKEVEYRKGVETKLDTTEKEKSKIKSLFEKYVDKDIAERAIANNLKKGMHNATFLFTDLRGYTKMSENPEKTLGLLNKYFGIITNAVHLNGGAISQLVGDCVEAMFNVTREQPEHIIKAVKAAVKIQRDFEQFNKTIGKNSLVSGIGIDSGKVYLGSVGADVTRYQPIGNAINIAYHLSKKSSNQILITKKINDAIKEKAKTKSLGVFPIKHHSIEIFELSILE